MPAIASVSPERTIIPPGAFSYYPLNPTWGDALVDEVESEPEPTQIALFEASDLEKAFQYAQSLEEDGRHRLQSILTQLDKTGRFRSFTPAVEPEQVLELKQTFPNFAEVLDEIAAHLALARLAGEDEAPLAFPPILLVGPPGVGKTYFAHKLCETLGADFNETSLNCNSAGFILSGLDMGWSSGKPGLVFRTLMESPVANSFILLDEIDKANKPGMASDPLGALYGLLEPHTAKRFRDEATTLPIDASYILLMATANNIGSIPEPLLSRMTVFEIPMPSASQIGDVARSVWKNLRENASWGEHFNERLPDDIINALGKHAPRHVTKLLSRAAGRAVMNKRVTLEPEDLYK